MNTVFAELPAGALFSCLSGEFSRFWSGRWYSFPSSSIFLKRSDTIVVVFTEDGFTSFPIGADYADVLVTHVPFPAIVRSQDDDLKRALRLLIEPYG